MRYSVDINENILQFVDKYFDEYRLNDDQIVVRTCPFCKGGNNNDEYTFFISGVDGAFTCFRGKCNKKGSFRMLTEAFGEIPNWSVGRSSNMKINKKKYALVAPDILKPITPDALKYMAVRKISPETLRAFHIGSDANGNILFPFYRNGILTYVKHRVPRKLTEEDKKNKIPKEWQEPGTEPILFGMDNVSFNLPLYITEGEIDALSLYESGIHNVVSVPCGCNNMEFVDLCWDWLEKFSQIVIFGDSDEAGLAMINTLTKRLGEDRVMLTPEYPELFVNGEDMNRPCKDANEILVTYSKEALYGIASSAKPAPIEGMLDLADVKVVDPNSIPKICTRIPALDDAIAGLCEGGITIFTGKSGHGKSTLSGELLLNAIAEDHKVCAYSGELSSEKFLEWIMLQATETKYIGLETDSRSGKKYAVVPQDVQDAIRNWIRGKFFIFDNMYNGGESIQKSILKVFTMCAKRYGTKLFLVDNMMTVVSGEDEELKAQTRFAAALKAFAVKYGVHVILVSHPRKTQTGVKIGNDDIAGSSNIGNLADTIIAVERVNDLPVLNVTKNRNFGTLTSIDCYYNPANRRMFQRNIGDKTIYPWDHTNVKIPELQACTDREFQIKLEQNIID